MVVLQSIFGDRIFVGVLFTAFMIILILCCGYSWKGGAPSPSISRTKRLEDDKKGLGGPVSRGPWPMFFSAIPEHDDPETSTERAIKRDPVKD